MRRVLSPSFKGPFLLFGLVFIALCFGPQGVDAFPRQAATEQASAEPALSGTVVESMSSGGYTYVCLEKNKQKTWVAVPSMDVKVGEEMSVHPGNQMGPFTSKTLNRTFDKIIFSGGPVAASAPAGMPESAAAMQPEHPPVPAATGKVKTAADKRPASGTVQTSGKVVETFDAGGYTYIRLEKDGQMSWAAVPPVKVKVGDEVKVRPGMEMGLFTSKTLDRTFDNIVFAPGLQTN